MIKQLHTKSAIRAVCKKALAEISDKERKEKSKLITEKVLSLPQYQTAKSIFIYLSTDSEVDTSAIIIDAFAKEKTVYVPIILEKMFAVRIDKDTKFSIGKLGIKEPEYFQLEEHAKIDLAIIPLVAFDKDKTRLGHGKGYYDYYLADFSGCKVALAFGVQCYPMLIAHPHDIVMDKVITENKIFH